MNRLIIRSKKSKRGRILQYPSSCLTPSTNSRPRSFAESKSAPTDDDNPNLIKINTVPSGTKFTFRTNGTITDEFKRAFTEMLEYAGLGAKIAVGYGWMQV